MLKTFVRALIFGPSVGYTGEVLLVRTADDASLQLPDGDGWNALPFIEQVVKEVRGEECAVVSTARFKELGHRRIFPNALAPCASLYVATLTRGEFSAVRKRLEAMRADGTDAAASISIEIRTVRELLSANDLDWATLGMIMQAFLKV